MGRGPESINVRDYVAEHGTMAGWYQTEYVEFRSTGGTKPVLE